MNPSPLSSSPLFSSIVTFYTLILLYLPRRILFSPVLLSTAVLLLSLLRLGANQRAQQTQENNTPPNRTHLLENESQEQLHHQFKSQSKHKSSSPQSQNPELGSGQGSEPKISGSCFQWDVSAPLEVIYEEAHEGQEGFEENVPDKIQLQSIETYPSLSKYYPETDSDSDEEEGEWDSWERKCFRWVDDREEEKDDGLIEIALDGGLRRLENEGFIEIDFLRKESVFSGE